MNTTLKALSLLQPWASLVALGEKKIETRSWKTLHRGPLVIQASARLPDDWEEIINEEPFVSTLRSHGYWATKRIPTGSIVAVAELVDCKPTDETDYIDFKGAWKVDGDVWQLTVNELAFGDYSPKRFAWLLKNVRALEKPVPCKGSLSLWEVPADIARQVYAQIAQPQDTKNFELLKNH